MSKESISVNLDGKEITIETGKMGRLADGACTVSCGETVVMVTAVSQTKMRVKATQRISQNSVTKLGLAA